MDHSDSKSTLNLGKAKCASSVEQCRHVLVLLVNLLRDDIRVAVLLELVAQGPCSLSSLARRLRVGHRKVGRALKQLESFGLIHTHLISVGKSRKYKYYSAEENLESILKEVLSSSS
jgi:predicted transcriptional regulator